MKLEFDIGHGTEEIEAYAWRINGEFVEFFETRELDSVFCAIYQPTFVRTRTLREPSLKAGVLSLPDVVKSESNLPA
jgi:hypothetical protein